MKADGDLSNYVPDFFVKIIDGTIYTVETKGRAELDLPRKMARLSQWCMDATQAEQGRVRYDFVFVDEDSFIKHTPKAFADLVTSFVEYKP